LRDGRGQVVRDLDSFVALESKPVGCRQEAPEENTGLAGDALLKSRSRRDGRPRYDPVRQQFVYRWKTARHWKGCRELKLLLADGTEHVARFKFR
jgi:hypothetical protein